MTWSGVALGPLSSRAEGEPTRVTDTLVDILALLGLTDVENAAEEIEATGQQIENSVDSVLGAAQ